MGYISFGVFRIDLSGRLSAFIYFNLKSHRGWYIPTRDEHEEKLSYGRELFSIFFSNMHLPLIGLQDLTCGMNLIERLLSNEDLAKSKITLAVGDTVTKMILAVYIYLRVVKVNLKYEIKILSGAEE